MPAIRDATPSHSTFRVAGSFAGPETWIMRLAKSSPRRRAVAAVEFAVLLPFLLLLLIGIWELGRMIQVQMMLNNAARDGARLAAQANIVTESGAYTQI